MSIMSGASRWDARVPLRFGAADDRAAGDFVLIEGTGWQETGAHGEGCVCCVPRGAAARALADLFRQRACGGAEFRAVLVVASPAGQAAVLAALRADPVVSARYRLA